MGLDPFGVRMLKDVILAISAPKARPYFLQTHSLHIAEELCDRVGLISRGSACQSQDERRVHAEKADSKAFIHQDKLMRYFTLVAALSRRYYSSQEFFDPEGLV